MAKRNALGRGLGALLENTDDAGSGSGEYAVNSISDILVNKIETNPYQPRTHFDEEALEELSESIKVQGIIQPITVRQLDNGTFQLISGERRLQASKLAGLKKIPAYIRKANDQQMLEMGLIENIQRENLNAIEIALSYQRLISECELKQDELGERVGKKRATVTNYLRLLKLPPEVQTGLIEGKLSMGHAKAILALEKADQQLSLYKKVLTEGLSVRKVEELARNFDTSTKKTTSSKKQPETNYEIKKLQSDLSSHFGTKVDVKATETGKGEIKIPFVSVEDLNRILEIIKE